MEQLKPCPNVLCGSEGVYTDSDLDDHFVECPDCFARGGWADTEEEAITYWNDRPQVFTAEQVKEIVNATLKRVTQHL